MTSSRHNISSPLRVDALLIFGLRFLAAVAGGIVLLILAFLVLESSPALGTMGVFRFFSDPSWHPLSGHFNMMPMVIASLAITLGAVLVAAPLGIGSALFCRFYAPQKIASVYRGLIQLLAGIPSVVYGFWALVVLVPILSPSLLAGIIILSLMILPTVALIADASLAQLPQEYVQGSAALGLGRWSMIRGVLLPSARGGLITALLLGTARAIGETMAVLMVCGNVVKMPKSLSDPVRTLTANIALEMSYAGGVHRSALFVSGLLLMGLVGLLVAIAEGLSRGRVYG
jgi:phosphate transport system permease protein